jgi:hypothetical protein
MSLGFHKGFHIANLEEFVSRLQCVDDTILAGEACKEDLWSTKAISTLFELEYDLKIRLF